MQKDQNAVPNSGAEKPVASTINRILPDNRKLATNPAPPKGRGGSRKKDWAATQFDNEVQMQAGTLRTYYYPNGTK
jgi:hypothetical protein